MDEEKKITLSTKKMRQRAMRQIPIIRCVKCQTYKMGDIPYTAIFSVAPRKLHKRSLKNQKEKKLLVPCKCTVQQQQ